MAAIHGRSKLYRLLFLAVALCIGIIGFVCLVSLNNNTQVIRAERGAADLRGMDFSGWLYLLSGEWDVYDGLYTSEEAQSATPRRAELRDDVPNGAATYVLRLQTDAELVVSQPISILRMWVNGTEVTGDAGGAPATSDMIALKPYGDGTYSITVQAKNTRRGYCGVLIGTPSQMEGMLSFWNLSDISKLGMYLMLSLVCFVLFLQKRSEKYVLVLSVLCLLMLLRLLVYPRIASLQRFAMPAFFFADVLHMLRFFILYYFAPKQTWKRCLPLTAVAAVVWLVGSVSGLYALQSASYFAYLLTEGFVIGRGLYEGAFGMKLLFVGWCVNASVEAFYFVLNFGLIRQGFIDVYIKPMSYASLVYLLSFVFVCFGVFAQKFRLADDLSTALERRVDEQTSKLQEANRNLLRIQNEKHDMMTNIAHNLKNPIFALLGYADILEKGDGANASEKNRLIMRIYDKIHDMSELVDDVLLLARFEDKRIEFHIMAVSISELLKNAASDASAKGKARNIQIVLDVKEAPNEIEGDTFRLRQAFDNVLDNAIRHSFDGGTVEVLARPSVLDSSPAVSVSVRDHGGGLGLKNPGNLFSRYDSKGSGGVTGLGLSITKEIIDAHGGTITVENAAEQGTVVIIILPLETRGEAAGDTQE